MTWTSRLGSGLDDARRRLVDAESNARDAMEGARSRAAAAVTAIRGAREPTDAVLDHAARAAVDFANAAMVPGVGEEGSAAERARPYVMVGVGLGSSVVTGRLG